MKTEIRARRAPLTEAFRHQVETRVFAAFGRFAHAIGRVSVRFADLNGPRGGVDKRCQVALDLRPGGRVLVEADAERIDLALSEAVARASAVLARQMGRTSRVVRGVRTPDAFEPSVA